MRRHAFLRLLPWLLLPTVTGALWAQVPTPEPAQVDPRPKAAPGVERSYRGRYSEAHSRELFRGCDRNSDDRLDVFEAADAFDVMRTARDRRSFAHLDVDRDGYVTWPEFDQRFRKAIEDGGTFHVRTCRELMLPEPPPQPLSPVEQFLRQHDQDGDGALSHEEIAELLRVLGLPPSVGAPLIASDLDQSGKIDVGELAPWFELLPKAATARTGAQSPLPQPWFDADRNNDGVVDAGEFAQLLRNLDPGLLRWTQRLLQRIDRDGDGKLTPAEVKHVSERPQPDGEDGKPTRPVRSAPAGMNQIPQR